MGPAPDARSGQVPDAGVGAGNHSPPSLREAPSLTDRGGEMGRAPDAKVGTRLRCATPGRRMMQWNVLAVLPSEH